MALLLGGAHYLAADALYSVAEVGTLGGTQTAGNDINDLGQVTGMSDTTAPGVSQAFVYSNGQPRAAD